MKVSDYHLIQMLDWHVAHLLCQTCQVPLLHKSQLHNNYNNASVFNEYMFT